MNCLACMSAVVLLLIAPPSAGATQDAADMYSAPRTISVSGHGTAGAEPDIATITAGVDIAYASAAMSVDEAAETMNEVMAAARDAGIEGEDMQTTYYNLWIEEDYDPYTGEYTGKKLYRVQHTIQLIVRDIDDVGDVLTAIVSAGIGNISGVYFSIDDPSELMDQAYQNAVEDARHRAELIASSLDAELGDVQYVSEYGSYYPSAYDAAYANYGGGMGYSTAPPVSPGSFQVAVDVQLTFELE